MAKGIAVGLNKGFIVTKIDEKKKKPLISRRKGKLNSKVATIRHIIREVVGLAPYEKRIVELLKQGGVKESKKALKIAKQRLGTHLRAKRKREILQDYVREQRKK